MHPHYVFNNIIKGQAIRAFRLNPTEEGYEEELANLKNRLLARSYNKREISNVFRSIEQSRHDKACTYFSDIGSDGYSSRHSSLQSTNYINSSQKFSLFYTYDFDQLKEIIFKHWKVLTIDPQIKEFVADYPQFLFQIKKNLHRILCYPKTMKIHSDITYNHVSQLSRQPEVNSNRVDQIKFKESKDNITAMGRNQTHLQILLKESEDKITAMGNNQTSLQLLLKESEDKITAMGKNQTSLQILLQKSEDMITTMGKNQMSLQMLIKQAEEKLTVMTKNQSNLQIQLKQAEVNITSVKTKQSSLETKVSQAEQKITALERNLSQIGLQGKCCPSGWDFLSPSCYYFATSAENWHSAQTRCKSLSSDLVVIKSAEEQSGYETAIFALKV
ncbi:C-type lectin domain family 4 member M-like [Protopterus annectens]|uniref:C-type lectin domain family 4 member M-like n=1 Tax=Protopterus annectens TaxID=7888 RepID=UPI001CF99876|nr:C-type lectin domain family 4 member M-like [Protopterus annectens]